MAAMLQVLRRPLFGLLMSVAGAAYGAAFAPSNLLVSDLSSGALYEYTRQGTLVQQFATPDFAGGFHDLRDIAAAGDGRVYMYNGTFTPALTILDPVSGHITNYQSQGWSTVNNVSYGGIGIWRNSVFVTDMPTFGDGNTEGIVRFDASSGASSRLPSPAGSAYTDLTVGFDGLLYAYGVGIDVFDPASGSFLRHIASSFGDVRGIAVDASGVIYAADWGGGIRRFSPSGLQIGSGLQTGESLTDIDLSASGQLVLGSRFGRVLLTDTSLQSFTSFSIGGDFGPTVHVAFAQAIPEPTVAALLVTGLAFLWLRAGRRTQSRPAVQIGS